MTRKVRWTIGCLGVAAAVFALTSGIHARTTVVMYSTQGPGPKGRMYVYNRQESRCWYHTVLGTLEHRSAGTGEEAYCRLIASFLAFGRQKLN